MDNRAMTPRQYCPAIVRGKPHGQTGFLRSGSGFPLVFVHGVGMNADIWQPQLETFATSRDVISIDMLGHGGSALPPEAPLLTDYADQLLSLLDALGTERVDLVGHSMGALVAIQTAIIRPERIRRLVPMNGVFRRPTAVKQAVLKRAEELQQFGLEASIQPTLDRWFGSPVPHRLRSATELARSALKSVDPVGYSRTYRLFATSDEAFVDTLPTLSVPTLFLTGEQDGNSSPAMSHEMAALAPNGRAEVLPGERHMMALASPELVNASLAAFLDGDRMRLVDSSAEPPALKQKV
jgi:pimeloyl-ACP methyl ester carboxylesterase